ncbi:alpha-glucosidase C-terminal domain-containing protein, partial [Sulfitobacter dubius]|uniref:alpha-glucosidase C-terminal domain-containing protein n=1 Tax=Sulfitobacter dubius TaxID=218673 RepID=UPI0022BA7FDC|nr:hypothetical protein [Sulfitobacter dubius]
DEDSVFYYYQKLIQLRKEITVITDGNYQDLLHEHEAIFAYQRRSATQTLVCLNNYYDVEVECELPQELELNNARYLIGNYSD